MERPEVRFARADDGAYLAYQTFGEGPTVLRREREILERWGTERWAREYAELNGDVMGGIWSTESYLRFLVRLHTTPG